jgi:diguanylate cyclase
MAMFRSNSFVYKITSMVLLANGIALGTLAMAFLVFDALSARSLLEARLATLADIVGENSAAALSFSDPAAAVEVLGALRAEPPVVSACIYDLPGNLFAQYRRSAATRSCPADYAHIPAFDRMHPGAIRPVLHRGELVGSLMLTSDLQDLERRRQLLLLVASTLMLLALVVGGISGSLLQRKISRPIFELARAMHHVTDQQNFSARVAVAGTDEIAQLGRSFNSMLSELERRDSEKRKAERQLQYQALNDELTGLPNRRLFADRLSQTLARAKRENQGVALLYIDLDGFKLVNDSLGHSIGDSLLIQVAERLRSRVRQSDTLARLGGDEFTVVLGTVHAKEDASLVANKLLHALTPPFLIKGHEITIGASVGISLFPQDAQTHGELIQQADSAMYAAKRNGKNRAMYFTPELGSLVRERLSLENQLRRAIVQGEIHVHYQPEFDVLTGRLVRFEALSRWTHPTLGPISPSKFIPVAEESGMIVTLGAYVLECACAQAVKWQSLAPHAIQVAVNVSSLQFCREGFVDEVTEVLNRTGLRPELLQIELTESVMLTGINRSSETMKRLRALGISLAIDDFGTGYSCLSYLPSLPFDSLKIDRSFVSELDRRPEANAMVHALIALAHNIGMRVIVEGVEKQEQLDLVRELGANEIQGFLLGKPVADPSLQLRMLNPQRDSQPALDSRT